MMNIIAICLISLLLCSCTAVTVIGHISSAYSTGKLLGDLYKNDIQSKDNVSDVWYGEPPTHHGDGDISK